MDLFLFGMQCLEEGLDTEDLYRRHIKVVYSDLLGFMSRLDTTKDEDHQQFWRACQMAALQLGLADGDELLRKVRRLGSDDDDSPLIRA